MKGNRDYHRRQVLALGGSLVAGMGLLRGWPAFAADKPNLKPAHVINTVGNATFILQKLIEQQGYYAQLGLEATDTNVEAGTKTIGSLLNGDQDISVLSGIGPVFSAIEKGAKLKIIGGADVLAVQTVYSKKPEIKELKDLVGKTVGTGGIGALEQQLVVALFEKKGIDYSKVTFANIGGSADIFRAVTAGTVDAGPGSIDVYDQQAKYGVHALSDADMWKEIPDYVYQGAYVSDDAIAQKRDILVRVLAVYGKAFRFIQGPGSKDAFIQARLAALNGTDPGQVRSEGEFEWNFFQKFKPFSENLVLSEEQMDYMQDLNLKTGTQKTKLPFSQVADMSLAQEAVKLLG